MKKNSEVRIQESECNQWGIQTRHFLVDHKTRKFGGGAKMPFIHPPVAQNTQVNSGS
ncbi:hypothetical protein [Nostoc sp.]|uniref:hypothetical protein n=1 Tax=Nostoc sp. TaxID=1180 RepID=UPI002A5C2F2E|nr:hypothetical protein [Nostoc sp. S13]